MDSILISADDIKGELSGYSPERAEEFHSQSAKIADKRFVKIIKTNPNEPVILMSGGPASGKTEYVSEYLMDRGCIIFDGILPTNKGADIKLGHIKKTGKKIEVHIVWPEDLRQAYVAFLHRDRKFSDTHFYEKHSSARATALYIAKNYPEVEIKLFKNAYIKGDLSFTELQFAVRSDLIAYLEENQYTKDDIIKLVTS